ncbi:MAG: chemotaxis protein CheW [Desulfuromonadales bacterium]|nr:chemotaxis protein CheW [Desulfuromonadales bacterium]
MDDIRENLLPVFLQEAQVKIPVVESFLTARTSSNCDGSALEGAYRAIHTLKGTAGLVRAEAIRKIALRIEKNLERHLEDDSSPTPAEYDALTLALAKISELLSALNKSGSLQETGTVGVFQALDLAEAFSGRSSSGAARISEDLFAEDGVFDAADSFPPSPAVADAQRHEAALPVDPFAEDGRFGLNKYRASASFFPAAGGTPASCTDPFAEDPQIALAESGRSGNRPAPEVRYCCFTLGEEQFSLPTGHLVEISDLPPVVALPLSPAYLHGMVNLRGEVIPVADLAACSGEPSPVRASRRMVVVEVQGEQFAFLCDGVPELSLEAAGTIIEPADFVNRYRLSET